MTQILLSVFIILLLAYSWYCLRYNFKKPLDQPVDFNTNKPMLERSLYALAILVTVLHLMSITNLKGYILIIVVWVTDRILYELAYNRELNNLEKSLRHDGLDDPKEVAKTMLEMRLKK